MDCLKRTALGESLSDDQKYLIRFDQPFNDSVFVDSESNVSLEQIQMQINLDSESELKSVQDTLETPLDDI